MFAQNYTNELEIGNVLLRTYYGSIYIAMTCRNLRHGTDANAAALAGAFASFS